jgi:hypothetical protein
MTIYECQWDVDNRSFHGSYREALAAGREYKGGPLIAEIWCREFELSKKGVLALLNHIV